VECLVIFVVCLVGVAALIVVAVRAQRKADRWNVVYRAVAARHAGSCSPAGWMGRPSIRFRYGATHVLINTQSQAGIPYTQVFISWPDAEFRCEIQSLRDGAARPSFPRGLVEADLGDEDFTRRFAVHTNNINLARVLLSDGVRWQVERLRAFLGHDNVGISMHRGRIHIRKATYLRRQEELEEFILLSLEFYDQGMLTRSVGIEFVDGGEAQIVREAVCKVCGEDIVTDMVFCRRCKTPHHVECWQYYGACSTYGCRETRFVAPRIANP
jgi:hypothetical protein